MREVTWNGKVYTKSDIMYTIVTNDSVAKDFLLTLYNNQVIFEQETRSTVLENTVGFNKSDAKSLSIFAVTLLEDGNLSYADMLIVHRRLRKYWAQMMNLIERGMY